MLPMTPQEKEIREDLLREMKTPYASNIIEAVRRHTGAEITDIVEIMWRLVDEAVIEYGADARLRFTNGN